jgi:hypothetical protein
MSGVVKLVRAETLRSQLKICCGTSNARVAAMRFIEAGES